MLIDECVCNNLHDVCLHNLINEEKKLQDEVRDNAKHWKDKFVMEKSMKEKEVMKTDKQMDECSCRNERIICAKNLSRKKS